MDDSRLVGMKQSFHTFLFLFAFIPSVCAANEAEHSLSGYLLIAAEKMVDSRFVGTVIYIYQHSKNGALGLVINRPVAWVPAASVAEQFEIEAESKNIDVQIFWGGPVHNSRGFILHSPDYVNDDSKIVAEGVVLTGDNEILEAILEGTGPADSIFALGYSGWGPGQLERELFRQDWLVLPANAEFIFNMDPQEMWGEALSSYSVEL